MYKKKIIVKTRLNNNYQYDGMNYNDFIMYSSKRTITSNLNQLITEYPDEMHRFSKSYASVNRNVFK